MEILINATSARLGGGITVIRNLIRGLLAVDGGRHRYTLIARPEVWPQLDPGDARAHLCTSRAAGAGFIGRVLWEQVELPIRSALQRADVVLSPANVAVPAVPVPQVLMFQNMAPFEPKLLSRYPWKKQLRLMTLRRMGLLSARRVRRIVFISDHARTAIEPLLGPRHPPTTRIYLGRDEAFNPGARASAQDIAREYGLAGRYLLCVSQFYRYKNFVELVHGFARACADLPGDVVLAFAGAEHEAEYAQQVRAAVAQHGLQDRVKFLGGVPYEKLPPLYAGAELFLFPSTCENFPNILVEGMACGAPTLASELGPMQEIAKDGATYFDPFSPDSIASSIRIMWHDEAARRDLSARGLRVVESYDWRSTARDMLATLEEAAR